MQDDYEYDVAFSFTQQDEALANRLNDLLSDRLKTFIYSERQKEIAGSDGQTTFSDVYGKKARIVVILYRAEWGQTRWTGVEMNAIKTRAFESGFDFTIFIPTEAKPSTPAWLPPTRLYVGLERFGVEGAAAAIEYRVTEAGGKSRAESVMERASRLKRATDLKAAQQRFERSEEGVRRANTAYEELAHSLKTQAEATRHSGIEMQYQESQSFRIVSLSPCNMICNWSPNYANSIEDTHLQVHCYWGFPKLPGYYGSFEKARELHNLKFRYQLVSIEHSAYVAGGASTREFDPPQLADFLLSQLMDIAERNPRK